MARKCPLSLLCRLRGALCCSPLLPALLTLTSVTALVCGVRRPCAGPRGGCFSFVLMLFVCVCVRHPLAPPPPSPSHYPPQRLASIQRLKYLVGQSEIFQMLIARSEGEEKGRKRAKADAAPVSRSSTVDSTPGSPKRQRRVARPGPEEEEKDGAW